MVRFYWTYILECADGSYYVGMTNDMDRRLEEHQSGHDPSAYTYTRRPVKLMFSEMSNTPEQAIALEKKLKRWSRAKKEALIHGEYVLLPGLSKKKFK
jgi:putative endonuclease